MPRRHSELLAREVRPIDTARLFQGVCPVPLPLSSSDH